MRLNGTVFKTNTNNRLLFNCQIISQLFHVRLSVANVSRTKFRLLAWVLCRPGSQSWHQSYIVVKITITNYE